VPPTQLPLLLLLLLVVVLVVVGWLHEYRIKRERRAAGRAVPTLVVIIVVYDALSCVCLLADRQADQPASQPADQPARRVTRGTC